MTDSRLLARALTLLALGCALAVWAWPSEGCPRCVAEVLRERSARGGEQR